MLGDPVRRRLLELLAGGEHSSGALVEVIQREFGISQPAVSQHLKVLRDNGFATVRADGARRFYTVSPAPLQEVSAWLDRFRRSWDQPLDALATELARGRRARRHPPGSANSETSGPDPTDPDTTPPEQSPKGSNR